jgi:hypothetical protein
MKDDFLFNRYFKRLKTDVKWLDEHFSSYKMYREKDPEKASQEFKYLEDTIEDIHEILKSMEEL